MHRGEEGKWERMRDRATSEGSRERAENGEGVWGEGERERERERDTQRERQRETERGKCIEVSAASVYLIEDRHTAAPQCLSLSVSL